MFNVIFQSINKKGEKKYSGLVVKEWSFISEDFNYKDKNDNYGEIAIEEIEFLKIDDVVVIKNNIFLGF